VNLREFYPTAADAVEWSESATTDDIWEEIRQINASVEEMLRVIHMVNLRWVLSGKAPAILLKAVAEKQFDTDDFRKYVMAKLGMM
jgi:hypothetical protein